VTVRDIDVVGLVGRYEFWVEDGEAALRDVSVAASALIEAERRKEVVLAREERRVASAMAPLAPARFRRLRRKLLDSNHIRPTAYQARRDMLVVATRLEHVELVETEAAARTSLADQSVIAARQTLVVARGRMSVTTGLPTSTIRQWWS